jgi:hypothetical protein
VNILTLRELPSAEAVHEWAREKRVFISSVMAEFVAERQAVAAGVRGVGLRAVLFEEFGGRDADPEEAYLAEVEGSDIYIGILGRRYGKPLKTRFSATHAEYLKARSMHCASQCGHRPQRIGRDMSSLFWMKFAHFTSFRHFAPAPTCSGRSRTG